MLSDREKLILHFVSVITIAKMTNMPNYEQMLETMIEEVRKNRCRSLNDDDIAVLLEEVNEEMVCGIEHHMNKQFTDALCTMLKHPRKCPHTHDIPMGECCENKYSN